ncbi:hypothetical protein LX32DRAFT_47997 [Colletotrichum zoysiae]|uniref:Uncharacterized protein n=1 Tax=Colletotrichum zoysiae TaxID=1216348 RepID=A0AAD9LYK7_9PEZI|nr:hypothetical protein LX32DRAFT_47997 [Colletotrichum zoysiae]
MPDPVKQTPSQPFAARLPTNACMHAFCRLGTNLLPLASHNDRPPWHRVANIARTSDQGMARRTAPIEAPPFLPLPAPRSSVSVVDHAGLVGARFLPSCPELQPSELWLHPSVWLLLLPNPTKEQPWREASSLSTSSVQPPSIRITRFFVSEPCPSLLPLVDSPAPSQSGSRRLITSHTRQKFIRKPIRASAPYYVPSNTRRITWYYLK